MEREKELMKIGEQFRLVRKEKGLSQSELAYKIGKDQQAIQRFEKGLVNPGYLFLLEICEGLEVRLIDVLMLAEKKYPK